MSERERWTVYPLLFLALGIALKDKLLSEVNVRDIRCTSMVCSTLVVDDPQQRVRVKLPPGTISCQNALAAGAVQSKNVVAVETMRGKNVVATEALQAENVAVVETMQCKNVVATESVQSTTLASTERVQGPAVICKSLAIPDPEGKVQALVSANDAGGFVRVVGSANGVTTFLGNTDAVAGLMFIDHQGHIHPRELFTPPVVPNRELPKDSSPEEDSSASEAGESKEPAAPEPATPGPQPAPADQEQP